MKLELKIEDGKTIIVFPEDIERDKTISVFSTQDGHSSAARSHIRQLRKPESQQELREAWQLLSNYSQYVLTTTFK